MSGGSRGESPAAAFAFSAAPRGERQEVAAMPATTDAPGLRGLAARWPGMDAEARRAATAPARAGRQRRFVEQAQREAVMGLIPPEEVERRVEELRSAHYRHLRGQQVAKARRDAAELR